MRTATSLSLTLLFLGAAACESDPAMGPGPDPASAECHSWTFDDGSLRGVEVTGQMIVQALRNEMSPTKNDGTKSPALGATVLVRPTAGSDVGTFALHVPLCGGGTNLSNKRVTANVLAEPAVAPGGPLVNVRLDPAVPAFWPTFSSSGWTLYQAEYTNPQPNYAGLPKNGIAPDVSNVHELTFVFEASRLTGPTPITFWFDDVQISDCDPSLPPLAGKCQPPAAAK
jgi:hypothetical protein